LCAEIHEVRALLQAKRGPQRPFFVPEFLTDRASVSTRMVDVGDPYAFFLGVVDDILNTYRPVPMPRIGLEDIVYQGFMRSFASLDARIGTALTQVAFLPFLRDRLGVTVFLSLPNGTIGETNRKGTRGSPFAVRNPFEIDPSFADPLLPEISASGQYKALSQACRALGMRMGSIIPMATLAIDSSLFGIFPELGFWWRASPGELVFCQDSDEAVKSFGPRRLFIGGSVEGRFVDAPGVAEVGRVPTATGLHFVAHDAQVTLANAFPDVLGGSAGTYTWQDVATVNYTNAVVPAPTGTAISEQAPELSSWALMPAVIAWRYHEFGERVQLIDVSPGVPAEVLVRAKRLAGGWRADLSDRLTRLGSGELDRPEAERLLADLREITEKDSITPVADLTIIGEELWQFDSPGPEFDAVVGPLIFCVSAHSRNRGLFFHSLRHHLDLLRERSGTNLYLAGASNHDTMPPVPGDVVLLYVLYCFLPGAVPFIFSGTEWGEQQITNKEFGFDTSEELLELRGQLGEELLGLFNDRPLDWDSLSNSRNGKMALVEVLANLLRLRQSVPMVSNWDYETLSSNNGFFGYIRTSSEGGDGFLIVAVNWDETPARLEWPYPQANLIRIGTEPISWDQCCITSGSVVTLSPASALIGLAL